VVEQLKNNTVLNMKMVSIPRFVQKNRTTKCVRLVGVISAGVLFLSAGLLQAQTLINVDFNGNSVGTAYGGGGVGTGPTMTGAAVLGSAGDQWNGFGDSAFTFANYPGGMSGSGLALNYANGSASGVTMSLTADGSYNANEPVWNNHSPFTTAASPYANLMQDLIYANVPQTLTLSGLAPNQAFNLVLYNAGDQNVGAGRTSTFTVNGVTQTSVWDGTTSTLVAGVDYVDFASATSDGTGTLVINYGVPGGSDGLETDLDGFQLLSSVPEPTTLACLAVAGTMGLVWRRRLARS